MEQYAHLVDDAVAFGKAQEGDMVSADAAVMCGWVGVWVDVCVCV
jgi:hypothetical protein